MSWWLRAHMALAEHTNWFPVPGSSSQPPVAPASGDPGPSSDSCSTCIQVYLHRPTHKHINKNNENNVGTK